MPPARVEEASPSLPPQPSPSTTPASSVATLATPSNHPTPKMFSPQWKPSPNAWKPTKSPHLHGKAGPLGVSRESSLRGLAGTPKEATLEPRFIARGNGRSLDVVVCAGAGLVSPWPAGRGRPGTTRERMLFKPPTDGPITSFAWSKRKDANGKGSSPLQRPQKALVAREKKNPAIVREISTWERSAKNLREKDGKEDKNAKVEKAEGKAKTDDKEKEKEEKKEEKKLPGKSPHTTAKDVAPTPPVAPMGSPSPQLEPQGLGSEDVVVASGPVAMETLLACPIEQVFEEFPRFLDEVRRQHPSTRMNLVLDWALDEKPERLLCTLFNCYSRGVFDVRKRRVSRDAPPPTPPIRSTPSATPTLSPAPLASKSSASSLKSAKSRQFDPSAAVFTPPTNFKKPGHLDPGAKEFRPSQKKIAEAAAAAKKETETPVDKPQKTPQTVAKTPQTLAKTPSSLSAAAPEWTPTMRPNSSRLNPAASEWTPNSLRPMSSAALSARATPKVAPPTPGLDADDLGGGMFEPLPAGPATFAAGKFGGPSYQDGSSFTLYDSEVRED